MQRILAAAASVTLWAATAAAVGPAAGGCEQTDLFVHAGKDWYRIPSIAAVGEKTVLAFASRRKGSLGDFGHETDVVLRRSIDGGRTFAAMQTLASRKDTDIHHGPVIVERGSGRVFKFCRFWPARANPQKTVSTTPYEEMKRLGWVDHMLHSDDVGASWSDPAPLLLDYPKGATSCATGNGVQGVQLRDGRMLIQGGYVAEGKRHICIFLSDDAGRTWRRGASAALDDIVREFVMAELGDGSLYVNVRSNRGHRWVAISRDRGESFGQFEMDRQLPDPACHAGLARLPGGGAATLLAFANPAGGGRKGLTVRLSRDGGKTWPVSRVIQAGPSAYCDVAVGPDSAVYCLYEGGAKAYEAITLARFDLGWITASASADR